MHRQLRLREVVKIELSRYEYLYNKLNKELSFMLRGTLVVDSNDNLYRYVREKDTQYKVRLTLNDQRLTLKLKKRRYIKKALKTLRQRSVYPDFTIYDRKRRRIIYWEHFGKVDDEAYMLRNLKKLEEYAKVGIILGDNLFITYESEAFPLSVKVIDDKLDEILS